MNHAIFNRLFLPSAHSLRSFAMLRRSILTAVHADFHFYVFYYTALISLTYYRLVFNRRLEIGDITTVDSHYKGSGHKRALASE